MKAVSPVRSGSGRRSGGPAGSSRTKSPAEEAAGPLLLLQDMSLCYRLLRRLVPGLPPGRPASRVEILQHVIDYILDLQSALDSSPTGASDQWDQCQHQHHQFNHQCNQQQPGPLTARTSDISILTFQSSDFPRESEPEESWTLLR
ncbi:DNA-binding protein inhibitor ID-2b [Centroberyx gerrardi]|uniref:DNA-binding protein inhibitor ID-2-like n=1 Tax=Centroberyx gerrardi TaxID=166262 RepID=UPI003AAF5E5E